MNNQSFILHKANSVQSHSALIRSHSYWIRRRWIFGSMAHYAFSSGYIFAHPFHLLSNVVDVHTTIWQRGWFFECEHFAYDFRRACAPCSFEIRIIWWLYFMYNLLFPNLPVSTSVYVCVYVWVCASMWMLLGCWVSAWLPGGNWYQLIFCQTNSCGFQPQSLNEKRYVLSSFVLEQ